MSNIPVNQLGPYAATNVNKASASQIDIFKDKLNDEVSYQQALTRVDFLQRTLNNKGLSRTEREAVELMLRDAQRDLAQLKQNLDAKYPA